MSIKYTTALHPDDPDPLYWRCPSCPDELDHETAADQLGVCLDCDVFLRNTETDEPFDRWFARTEEPTK